MEREQCGRVATYCVKVKDGKKVNLCTRHFSNDDIQYLITRKWIEYKRLENGEEKCEVEVERKAPPG